MGIETLTIDEVHQQFVLNDIIRKGRHISCAYSRQNLHLNLPCLLRLSSRICL